MIDATLIPFLPINQHAIILGCLRGEEREFFVKKIEEMKAVIHAMPVTYSQSELGDEAIVHLHYFFGGCDWYITEKDAEGDGTVQAFGLVNLGHGYELGYVSIQEIIQHPFIDLDLHWQPKTLAEIKKQ